MTPIKVSYLRGTRGATGTGGKPVKFCPRLLSYGNDLATALDLVCAETGKSIPHVTLNWLLQRQSVASVIIGARNEEQLIANIGAVGWALNPEQIKALDAASDTPASYPVWHQRGFPQLNERNRRI